jgi:hypothetical protein
MGHALAAAIPASERPRGRQTRRQTPAQTLRQTDGCYTSPTPVGLKISGLSADRIADGVVMDVSEAEGIALTMSFIVKLWLEEIAEETDQMVWRGHITHVPSGTRRYFSALDQIAEFVGPYLTESGASA